MSLWDYVSCVAWEAGERSCAAITYLLHAVFLLCAEPSPLFRSIIWQLLLEIVSCTIARICLHGFPPTKHEFLEEKH